MIAATYVWLMAGGQHLLCVPKRCLDELVGKELDLVITVGFALPCVIAILSARIVMDGIKVNLLKHPIAAPNVPCDCATN